MPKTARKSPNGAGKGGKNVFLKTRKFFSGRRPEPRFSSFLFFLLLPPFALSLFSLFFSNPSSPPPSRPLPRRQPTFQPPLQEIGQIDRTNPCGPGLPAKFRGLDLCRTAISGGAFLHFCHPLGGTGVYEFTGGRTKCRPCFLRLAFLHFCHVTGTAEQGRPQAWPARVCPFHLSDLCPESPIRQATPGSSPFTKARPRNFHLRLEVPDRAEISTGGRSL